MHNPSSKIVLFIQGSTALGGSTRSLLDSIEILQEAGYQSVVVCPRQGWLTEQLELNKIRYLLLPSYAWRKWLERPRVVPSIRRHWLPALAPWRLNIVHSNEFWLAPHAVLVAGYLKIPSIVHLRDGHHTLKKAYQYRLTKANLVLAVSTELRNQIATDPDLYNKTIVLFNGHENREFNGSREKAREQFHLRPEELVVGNVGKLSERKNQRLLLMAMAQLKRQKRLTKFKVLFAGEAMPEYARLMSQDVQDLGLQHEVQFLGPVKNMGAFFATINLLVHCARREGLSRVLPEAMLAKRAVVATAAEGVRDSIPDERFGSVVPIDDQQARPWTRLRRGCVPSLLLGQSLP